MPDLRDYHDLMQRQAIRAAKGIRAVPRETLTMLTHKAQTVVDHPGWQYFLDALQSRVEILQRNRASIITSMTDSPAMGPALEALKVQLKVVDGELAGLRYAATLIPNAVTIGQHIAADLSGVTPRAAASPPTQDTGASAPGAANLNGRKET